MNDEIKNDIYNYRGYFIEKEVKDVSPHFFEFGAHFQYNELYNALNYLKQKRINMQKGKQTQKIFNIKKKKLNLRERNNSKNKENNLNNIINLFQPKGKSRNIAKGQGEYTFNPKNNVNQIISIKKEIRNKSVNNYKSKYSAINYSKIYKNKISNIKRNMFKIGKLSEQYLLMKKKQNLLLNRRILLFSKIKQKTHHEQNKYQNKFYDTNLQTSFQTQIKPTKKISKKNLNLNFLPLFSNFLKKEIIKTTEPNQNKISSIKIKLGNYKQLNKEMISSTPSNSILNNYKSKLKNFKGTNYSEKLKERETKKIQTAINNEQKSNDNNNDNSYQTKNKVYISLLIDDNKNKKIVPKIKSVKHQINDIKRSSTSKQNYLIIPNINTEINKKKNNVIKIENSKKYLKTAKGKESVNILFDSNEKNSRNKLVSFLNNLNFTNFTDNKSIETNLSKINITQQDLKELSKYGKYNNNYNNNITSKYFSIKSFYPNSNKNKSFNSQLFNNKHILNNNYYSTGFIISKPQKKKLKATVNNIILDKPKRKVVTKEIKTFQKSNKDFKNKIKLKNNILQTNHGIINKTKISLKKGITKTVVSKIEIKKNQTLNNKYENLINNNCNNKNNINININISNNNSNIIYNNNFCKDKIYSRMNIQKINPKKKTFTRINVNISNVDKTKKTNMTKQIEIKKDNNKIKLIDIQIPKLSS